MRSLFPWVSLGCFCRKTTACAMPLSFRSRALRVGSCGGTGGGDRHSEDPDWGDEGPTSPDWYSPPSGPSAAPSWSAVLGGTCQVEGWSTLWSLSSGQTPWTSPPSLVWGRRTSSQLSCLLGATAVKSEAAGWKQGLLTSSGAPWAAEADALFSAPASSGCSAPGPPVKRNDQRWWRVGPLVGKMWGENEPGQTWAAAFIMLIMSLTSLAAVGSTSLLPLLPLRKVKPKSCFGGATVLTLAGQSGWFLPSFQFFNTYCLLFPECLSPLCPSKTRQNGGLIWKLMFLLIFWHRVKAYNLCQF